MKNTFFRQYIARFIALRQMHLVIFLLSLFALSGVGVSIHTPSVAAAPTVTATISVGSNPAGVGVNSSTNHIYVANLNDRTVSVIDGAANTVISTISVGYNPNGVGVNSSTNRIYVANGNSNTVSVIEDSASGGTWATKTSMSAARSLAAAGVITDVLYVAGGHDGTGGTTTLQAYNPTTNTWSTLAAMPGRRYLPDGTGVIDGKLYVPGGWNYPDSGLPTNTLFVYDPATNQWSTGAPMPQQVLYGSAGGATGVIGGKLYVTTPENGYSGYYPYLHVYDPATNAWSQLASSPNVHDLPAFGVIGSKFYVAGGGDANGTPSDKLDVYDPATNTWTTKASMPAVLRGSAGAVMNGKLYAIGGYVTGAYYNTVYVYDPSADTWTTETSMPTARYGAAGGVINGVIYVAGGSNSTGTLATVEAFTFSSLPTATTGSATNVTSNSATLNGTVNANGLSTTAWFNYGIASGSYTGTSTTQSVSGSSDTTVSIGVSGLSSSTTYYYRIAASSSAGTSYGSEASFSTTSSSVTPTPSSTPSTTPSPSPSPTPSSTPSPAPSPSPSPTPSSTPTTTASKVYGYVKNNYGSNAPIASAKIQLRGISTGKTKKATSGKDGYFELNNVAEGEYSIWVRKTGYKIYKGRLSVEAGNLEVDIMMAKARGRAVSSMRIIQAE